MESWPFTTTQLVMLACAPLLMVVVSLFERRWGPRVAGIVAAAPITALIGLLLVHSDLGETASREMALKMSGYIPAQIGVAVVVIALVGRTGYVPGLFVGILTYACLAALAAHLPVTVAIAASLLLLGVGQRLVRAPVGPDGDAQPMVTAGPLMIAVRAGVSLVTALGLLVTAQRIGPAAGGAIGAFPIFTFTLCTFVFTASGERGVWHVLAGMVQGLPPYFAFVLTFGLTVTHLGALGGSIAGGSVCACCYLASGWRSASVARLVDRRPVPSYRIPDPIRITSGVSGRPHTGMTARIAASSGASSRASGRPLQSVVLPGVSDSARSTAATACAMVVSTSGTGLSSG